MATLITTIVPHIYIDFIVYFQNNHYNISHIPYNTQRITTKSRVLAEIERSNNPHYHNDPELKGIIDKLNEEAIKKYQQTYDPYEQLQDVVEKNGTKTMSGHMAEPMSTIEKELLEIYEEMFGEKYGTILNPGINCNQNDKSCECPNDKKTCDKLFLSNKEHDKYLYNLKKGCVGAVHTCARSSIITRNFGISAAADTTGLVATNDIATLIAAIKTGATSAAFFSYGTAIVALIPVIIIVILLYIWLYRRRKTTWKHECKKHLCT
ncbi:stevor PIR protein, putative [Plasmodium sp. gorilla clade G2]|uniref:stevor PIR protein, putative n=1 Tax=Plasmodium sp. gorilla clade G2 TaxID=880535 RepID=UPI000D266ECC|nr:stevor PIR protein, putative [Plasmodium sp. gorilla clade G2]SOV20413.1 stevor PIR protein, putative [Plasmodium sp. gorilla clade G2]